MEGTEHRNKLMNVASLSMRRKGRQTELSVWEASALTIH